MVLRRKGPEWRSNQGPLLENIVSALDSPRRPVRVIEPTRVWMRVTHATATASCGRRAGGDRAAQVDGLSLNPWRTSDCANLTTLLRL